MNPLMRYLLTLRPAEEESGGHLVEYEFEISYDDACAIRMSEEIAAHETFEMADGKFHQVLPMKLES